MPRFSAKAKEIHDLIWYYTDLEKAEKLLEGLTDPLDIAFGKLFIEYYFMAFEQQQRFLELLTEIENENRILKDQFLQFIINFYYCLYYIGWNNQIVSKDQAEKYLEKIEHSCKEIDYKDNWEKYYSLMWFYYTKALYTNSINGDLSDAINFQKQAVEAGSKVPEEGEYFSDTAHIMLGYYYMWNGDFEEAEKSLNRGLTSFKQYNNLYQIWPLGNLFRLNRLKGNFQKAIEFNSQHYNLAKQLNGISGIFWSLTMKGSLLFKEGNYDGAIEAYQESLSYRKQYEDPIQIFNGYFDVFGFYYNRFIITKNKEFLKQAEQKLNALRDLSETHSDNNTIVNYTNYARALILKFGNIRKKGKALDILEELIEIYPNDIEISLNLLELLFEEVLLSDNEDTINQIDELMLKLDKIPLRNNPSAIFSFISQQIILAKYDYYIKGDLSLALDILYNAKDHIKSYKLDKLVHELDTEIRVFEEEITKWDKVDITVKERIKKSEFNKYIQEALKYAEEQL